MAHYAYQRWSAVVGKIQRGYGIISIFIFVGCILQVACYTRVASIHDPQCFGDRGHIIYQILGVMKFTYVGPALNSLGYNQEDKAWAIVVIFGFQILLDLSSSFVLLKATSPTEKPVDAMVYGRAWIIVVAILGGVGDVVFNTSVRSWVVLGISLGIRFVLVSIVYRYVLELEHEVRQTAPAKLPYVLTPRVASKRYPENPFVVYPGYSIETIENHNNGYI